MKRTCVLFERSVAGRKDRLYAWLVKTLLRASYYPSVTYTFESQDEEGIITRVPLQKWVRTTDPDDVLMVTGQTWNLPDWRFQIHTVPDRLGVCPCAIEPPVVAPILFYMTCRQTIGCVFRHILKPRFMRRPGPPHRAGVWLRFQKATSVPR